MPENPLVVIRSLVYNHEPYLRQCLDGFVMQQTTFPFVAVVHDDCSTDNSAAILREYAEKYPDIIKPIYETENQYSKRDGSLRRVMDAACGKYGPDAKYYALCEGDDCWTDPHKLQKQVEFLEAHPDYTMVCSDAVVRTPEGDLTEDDFRRRCWYRYQDSRDMAVEDIIVEGGWFIHTASIVYRAGMRDDYPDACRQCPVGDYPLQIYAALKGRVYYFHEKMVVYHWWHAASWSARQDKKPAAAALQHLRAELQMLQSLDEYSNHRYGASFNAARAKLIAGFMGRYPEECDSLMKENREILLYSALSPHIRKQQEKSWVSAVQDMWERLCFYPYYPLGNSPCLLNWLARPFYTVTPAKSTIHIGRLNFASFVRTKTGVHLYMLGIRVG